MGTVKGDLHDIGKNLCIMMLRGAGFEVIDLGVDTSPDAFIEAVEEHRPQLLGMSALLTTTMPNMGKTIEAFIDAGLRDAVRIMVGGAPRHPGSSPTTWAPTGTARTRSRAWRSRSHSSPKGPACVPDRSMSGSDGHGGAAPGRS